MKEVLKLALDALERGESKLRFEAITAIKEALSEQPLDMVRQAEPKGLFVGMIESHGTEFAEEIKRVGKAEPVACKPLCELCVKRGYDFCANVAKTTPIIIPTPSPQQAEPKYKVTVIDDHHLAGVPLEQWGKQQAEPVAWMDDFDLIIRTDWVGPLRWKGSFVGAGRAIPDQWTPVLYATPPQRPWQGLTPEEIHQLDPLPHDTFNQQRLDFARAIETKLREKNT
jgi:hypothetical protein